LKRYPLPAGPVPPSETKMSPGFSVTIGGVTSLKVTVIVPVSTMFPSVFLTAARVREGVRNQPHSQEIRT